MAKVKIYPVVEFTKEYAGKAVGETLKCGRQLAAELIAAGVAKYAEAEKTETVEVEQPQTETVEVEQPQTEKVEVEQPQTETVEVEQPEADQQKSTETTVKNNQKSKRK